MEREKWQTPQRNAEVGDVVLMQEKNQPRLQWCTGHITSVTVGKEGLVHRVFVQPHPRPDRPTTATARERDVRTLVLLKRINDQSSVEDEVLPHTPPEDSQPSTTPANVGSYSSTPPNTVLWSKRPVVPQPMPKRGKQATCGSIDE